MSLISRIDAFLKGNGDIVCTQKEQEYEVREDVPDVLEIVGSTVSIWKVQINDLQLQSEALCVTAIYLEVS